MKDGVEAIYICQGRIADILAQLGDIRDPVTESAALEKVRVEADYFMPGFQQHWH
jgi:hypothetical protein